MTLAIGLKSLRSHHPVLVAPPILAVCLPSRWLPWSGGLKPQNLLKVCSLFLEVFDSVKPVGTNDLNAAFDAWPYQPYSD